MSVVTRVVAKAQRSGEWWAVEVAEIPGLFTQAKRLDQIEEMVQDAAELLGYGEVEVVVEPHLDGVLDHKVEDTKESLAAAARVQQEASGKSRATAAALRAAGLTVRDVAAVLGVSAQRISQLVPGTKSR